MNQLNWSILKENICQLLQQLDQSRILGKNLKNQLNFRDLQRNYQETYSGYKKALGILDIRLEYQLKTIQFFTEASDIVQKLEQSCESFMNPNEKFIITEEVVRILEQLSSHSMKTKNMAEDLRATIKENKTITTPLQRSEKDRESYVIRQLNHSLSPSHNEQQPSNPIESENNSPQLQNKREKNIFEPSATASFTQNYFSPHPQVGQLSNNPSPKSVQFEQKSLSPSPQKQKPIIDNKYHFESIQSRRKQNYDSLDRSLSNSNNKRSIFQGGILTLRITSLTGLSDNIKKDWGGSRYYVKVILNDQLEKNTMSQDIKKIDLNSTLDFHLTTSIAQITFRIYVIDRQGNEVMANETISVKQGVVLFKADQFLHESVAFPNMKLCILHFKFQFIPMSQNKREKQSLFEAIYFESNKKKNFSSHRQLPSTSSKGNRANITFEQAIDSSPGSKSSNNSIKFQDYTPSRGNVQSHTESSQSPMKSTFNPFQNSSPQTNKIQSHLNYTTEDPAYTFYSQRNSIRDQVPSLNFENKSPLSKSSYEELNRLNKFQSEKYY